MPYCTKCGNDVSSDTQFCSMCGNVVKIESDSAPPVYTQEVKGSNNLFARMIRAARLDTSLYEEVEGDETATTQALIVVVVSSICSGIGTGLYRALTGYGIVGITTGLFGGLISALIVWFAWSFVTYFIGTRVFKGTASFSELLRTIGFSDSPRVLLIFSFIPIFGGFISFGVWVWGLAAMVVAVKQALDFSTNKAVLTCIVGWIVALALQVIIGVVLAIPFILGS